jgi:hypothetical protein
VGAWDTGPFDNDAALDWLAELEESGIAAIRSALGRVGSHGRPEADDVSVAVAAAAVLAVAWGTVDSAVPDEVSDWVATQAGLLPTELRPAAIAALDRILTASELGELWEQSDEFDAWQAATSAIRTALGAT